MWREERRNPLEDEVRLKWGLWTQEQPDYELLSWELTQIEEWEFTRGQVEEPRLQLHRRELIAWAQKVREQGYGDVIDQYWSHLAQLETQEKNAHPPYPLPLHSPRDGEPPRPQFVWYEENAIGTQRAKEAKRGRREWIAWAKQQPDHKLLNREFTFYQLWFYGNDIFFKFLSEETASYIQEQQPDLHNLRFAGYGDIIERYWSYLLLYQPPSE